MFGTRGTTPKFSNTWMWDQLDGIKMFHWLQITSNCSSLVGYIEQFLLDSALHDQTSLFVITYQWVIACG